MGNKFPNLGIIWPKKLGKIGLKKIPRLGWPGFKAEGYGNVYGSKIVSIMNWKMLDQPKFEG